MKWLFIIVVLVLTCPAAAEDGGAIVGVWLTEEGDARVEIYRDGDKFSGKIVWIEPNYPENDEEGMGGKPKLDRNNPDESRRDRPIVGLRIVSNFVYDGDNKWKDGRIYDPKNGKTYKCKMKLTDEDVLEVRGYVGFSLLGRTTKWTRWQDDDNATNAADNC